VRKVFATAAILSLIAAAPSAAQDSNMSFFITSVGSGNGANLGGLEGADQHCQDLAYAQGFGNVTWRAYLSARSVAGNMSVVTGIRSGGGAVNARDRIGEGPWHNYGGELIAESVEQLHSEDANLTKETILTEKGDQVNGRGDDPNMHDILTGSNMDGTVNTDEGHDACRNWTGASAEGSAMVGHHDRQGGGANPNSWNSAHASRGCSQENLQATGGNGYFYCFATDAAQQQEQAFLER
jgi:hypothetical protein